MSSTNKTTNYQLSQFIGTDKPAWLSDYNGDMGKIDAGVAAAQNTATGADGKATANATAIGTLSSLTTEAKTNLVAAVNEVNTSAATALNTATNAAGNASQAKNATDALKSYLAMTNFKNIETSEVVASVGTVDHSWLKVARNADGTLGKIYGRIDHIASSTAFELQTLTVNVDTGLRPKSDFDIVSAGIAQCMDSTVSQENIQVTITVKTTGKLVLTFYSRSGGKIYGLIFPPCLYFIQDFGDTPTES
jgi:hypothetical protein